MVEIKEYVGHRPVELKENVIKVKGKNNVKQDVKKEETKNDTKKNNKK